MITTIEHGAVRELRLNHPPVNALTPALFGELNEKLEKAATEVRAVVLSGTPGMFSAGLDVPLLLTLDRGAIGDLWRVFYALLRTLACSRIPIAAAITGHAPAGGTVLPLFCDWRVMAQGDWKIGLSEVQVGLILPPVIFQAFRRQVGAREAAARAVRGLLFSPNEAECIGLVEELAPADHVVERAVQWCQTLLALPSRAMLATRAQARADLVSLFDEGLEQEVEGVVEMWWSPDVQEALHAFVERLKRKK